MYIFFSWRFNFFLILFQDVKSVKFRQNLMEKRLKICNVFNIRTKLFGTDLQTFKFTKKKKTPIHIQDIIVSRITINRKANKYELWLYIKKNPAE